MRSLFIIISIIIPFLGKAQSVFGPDPYDEAIKIVQNANQKKDSKKTLHYLSSDSIYSITKKHNIFKSELTAENKYGMLLKTVRKSNKFYIHIGSIEYNGRLKRKTGNIKHVLCEAEEVKFSIDYTKSGYSTTIIKPENASDKLIENIEEIKLLTIELINKLLLH